MSKLLFLILVLFFLAGCGPPVAQTTQKIGRSGSLNYDYVCIDGIKYLQVFGYYKFGITTLLDGDGRPVMCENE